MFRRAIIILLFSLFVYKIEAQDAHLSQFYSAPLYLNPAMAGTTGGIRISSSYRLQWPNINGGFQTINYCTDAYLSKVRGGIGLVFQNNISPQGILQNKHIGLIYSQQIKLFGGKIIIAPALQFSFLQYSLDWSKLSFGDQIDPRRGFVWGTQEIPGSYPIQKTSMLDFGTGLVLYTSRLNLGAALHHFTQPGYGFIYGTMLPMKLTLHGAYTFGNISEEKGCSFTSNFLILKQLDFQEYVLGTSFKYNRIVAGLAYRVNDALIGYAGFQNRFFKLVYSYDAGVSKLTQTGGAHEVSLQGFFGKKLNKEGRITYTPLSP